VAPPKIDHRGWARIENQGPIGSCVGHGSSGASEVLTYLDTKGTIEEYSRMFAYKTAQEIDGLRGPDTGAMVSGALKASKAIGQCPEEMYPYDAKGYSKPIPPGCREAAGKKKIIGQHAILRSYQEVFDWLGSGTGVVIVGIPWYETFANTQGVINQAQGRKLGGHCVLWAGYTERKDSQGRNYIDCKNSHGQEWGDEGWAEFSPAVVEILCGGSQSGNEVIGLTDIMDDGPIEPRDDWSWMDYVNI
jgi:C1A family cysteine protease